MIEFPGLSLNDATRLYVTKLKSFCSCDLVELDGVMPRSYSKSGALIGDGDCKHAPFLVLWLSL